MYSAGYIVSELFEPLEKFGGCDAMRSKETSQTSVKAQAAALHSSDASPDSASGMRGGQTVRLSKCSFRVHVTLSSWWKWMSQRDGCGVN